MHIRSTGYAKPDPPICSPRFTCTYFSMANKFLLNKIILPLLSVMHSQMQVITKFYMCDNVILKQKIILSCTELMSYKKPSLNAVKIQVLIKVN